MTHPLGCGKGVKGVATESRGVIVKSKSRFFSTKQPTFHIATFPITRSDEELLIALKTTRREPITRRC